VIPVLHCTYRASSRLSTGLRYGRRTDAGNEKSVGKTISNLHRLGATVIHVRLKPGASVRRAMASFAGTRRASSAVSSENLPASGISDVRMFGYDEHLKMEARPPKAREGSLGQGAEPARWIVVAVVDL